MINAIFLKISTILFLLAMLVPLMKQGLKKNILKKDRAIYKIATFIDVRHEIIGKLALLTAFVHGLISSVKILSLNWGTFCFATIILSLIPCAFHKQDKKDAGLILHILLSVIAFVMFILHVILEAV